MKTKKKNTLPKSRAELRERSKKYTASEQCQTSSCDSQASCLPQASCPPASYLPQPYYPHHMNYQLRQCLHAPYNCVTHRQRSFWCAHCTSTYLFPEVHCNYLPYVSYVNSQPPSYNIAHSVPCSTPQVTCSIPQTTCSIPQTTCSIPQTTCSIPQTTCTTSQTSCSIPQTTCSLP